MRFPAMFSRVVNGSTDTLGTDTVPTTAPNAVSMDNLMTSKFSNINGWPIHRVAVTYSGPSMALDLPSTLWFWEEQTQKWYQIGDSVSLKASRVTFFDIVGLLDNSQAGYTTAGSVAVLLIVTKASMSPNGTYTFAMGPDLTTF